MARYLGPTLRLSRREGEDLGHKSGIRPLDQKCNIKNKPGNPPKNLRMKTSDYLNHLRAKQKMRRYYNVLERQFRGYFRKAARSRGDTGTNLVQMLESRLDNIVYRMGFARTRSEARQMVSHKLIHVDGKTVSIPSYQVRIGQEVSVKPLAREHERVRDAISIAENSSAEYGWLDVDFAAFAGKVVDKADTNAIGIYFDQGMVIEYYSK